MITTTGINLKIIKEADEIIIAVIMNTKKIVFLLMIFHIIITYSFQINIIQLIMMDILLIYKMNIKN